MRSSRWVGPKTKLAQRIRFDQLCGKQLVGASREAFERRLHAGLFPFVTFRVDRVGVAGGFDCLRPQPNNLRTPIDLTPRKNESLQHAHSVK